MSSFILFSHSSPFCALNSCSIACMAQIFNEPLLPRINLKIVNIRRFSVVIKLHLFHMVSQSLQNPVAVICGRDLPCSYLPCISIEHRTRKSAFADWFPLSLSVLPSKTRKTNSKMKYRNLAVGWFQYQSNILVWRSFTNTFRTLTLLLQNQPTTWLNI